MTSAAERYRQEWAIKTGRNPVDVYVPAALLEKKTHEVRSETEIAMTSAAERYRQEWAIKTGRNPVDVYVPAALLEKKTHEVRSLHERRTKQRTPSRLAVLSSAHMAA